MLNLSKLLGKFKKIIQIRHGIQYLPRVCPMLLLLFFTSNTHSIYGRVEKEFCSTQPPFIDNLNHYLVLVLPHTPRPRNVWFLICFHHFSNSISNNVFTIIASLPPSQLSVALRKSNCLKCVRWPIHRPL